MHQKQIAIVWKTGIYRHQNCCCGCSYCTQILNALLVPIPPLILCAKPNNAHGAHSKARRESENGIHRRDGHHTSFPGWVEERMATATPAIRPPSCHRSAGWAKGSFCGCFFLLAAALATAGFAMASACPAQLLWCCDVPSEDFQNHAVACMRKGSRSCVSASTVASATPSRTTAAEVPGTSANEATGTRSAYRPCFFSRPLPCSWFSYRPFLRRALCAHHRCASPTSRDFKSDIVLFLRTFLFLNAPEHTGSLSSLCSSCTRSWGT